MTYRAINHKPRCTSWYVRITKRTSYDVCKSYANHYIHTYTTRSHMITNGVIQGSILWILLFNIWIISLLKFMYKHSLLFHTYIRIPLHHRLRYNINSQMSIGKLTSFQTPQNRNNTLPFTTPQQTSFYHTSTYHHWQHIKSQHSTSGTQNHSPSQPRLHILSHHH